MAGPLQSIAADRHSQRRPEFAPFPSVQKASPRTSKSRPGRLGRTIAAGCFSCGSCFCCCSFFRPSPFLGAHPRSPCCFSHVASSFGRNKERKSERPVSRAPDFARQNPPRRPRLASAAAACRCSDRFPCERVYLPVRREAHHSLSVATYPAHSTSSTV